MLKRFRKLKLVVLIFFLTGVVYAKGAVYFGVSTGYASTDWSMLKSKDVYPVNMSSPIAVRDYGTVATIEGGYWLTKQFAVQASCSLYPDSHITIGPNSFYWPDRNTATTFTSKTRSYALLGQFNVPLNRRYAGYASIGIEDVHRHDVLAKIDHVGAIFGAGITADMDKNTQFKINFDYYTGYGKADMYPVKYYVPFIYKLTIGADVFL